jgi:PAS domain S-box-containing protein
VLSGLDDEETAIKAVQTGVQDYLIKGKVDSNLLMRAVSYAIERKKTERQLQAAEERYRTIFENSAVAIMMADEEGRLLSWNKFTEYLLGMDKEDLHLRHVKSLYPEEEWQKIRSLNVRQKGMENQLETKMVKKNGEVIDVDISISVLKDSDGNPTGSIGVIQDITERKRAEARTESSFSLLHATLESTADGILVVDNEGKITTYNQKYVEMWHIPKEVMESADDSRRLELASQQVKNCEQYLSKVKQLYSQPEQQDYDIIELNDGRVFERYSQPQYITGQVCGRVWSFRDITERRKIHEILDRKQKNLEAIFDAAPLGMLLVGEDMQIKRANEAIKQLAGKDYSEIINQLPGAALGCVNYAGRGEPGMKCGDMPPCAVCLLRNTIRTSLETEQRIHGVETQTTLRCGDKETNLWLSISAEPVNIDGRKHIVVAIYDITDRKRAEDELKATMELKSQFISTVSHELRTPLTSMKESVSIVLDELAGKINDDQKHFLDIAKRNIDRLSRLINDVLDFQKLSAGKMKFNMQENDIKKIADDAYTTMVPFADKKKVHLSVQLEDRLPKAIFDSDRIIQVITNLLSNSIKFTPEDGKVSLSVQCHGEELVIRISDTGMGIPKDALPKIFDQFYRVHRPGKEIKGTGLGLANTSYYGQSFSSSHNFASSAKSLTFTVPS